MMELVAGYRGHSAQIGSPVCIGEPPREVRRFFDEIVLPGFERMVAVARPGHRLQELLQAEAKGNRQSATEAYFLAAMAYHFACNNMPHRYRPLIGDFLVKHLRAQGT